MLQTAVRICKAILFYLSHNQSLTFRPCQQFSEQSLDTDKPQPITNTAVLLLWTHRLIRSLTQKTWGDGSNVLLQLVIHSHMSDAQEGIGPTALHNLEQGQLTTFDAIIRTPIPSVPLHNHYNMQLDTIIGRRIGQQIKNQIQSIPRLHMSLMPVGYLILIHFQTSSTSITITIVSPQMNSIAHYSSYGIGLYTLLVLNSDENKPLVYKQVSSEGSYSVTLPPKHDQTVIYLINNRWIGVDEEIHLGEPSDPIPRKKKPKAKAAESSNASQIQPSTTSHVQPAKTPQAIPNQDELDLLNFISWEDEKEAENIHKDQSGIRSNTYPNLVIDTPQTVSNHPGTQNKMITIPNTTSPTNNSLNVDEFLSSLFH